MIPVLTFKLYKMKNFFQRKLALITAGLLSLTCAHHVKAQFVPTTTAETTYPASTISPTFFNPSIVGPGFALPSFAVPGLFANAHMSTVTGTPGDPTGTDGQIAEVAAWTEDDGAGWENGYFTYGYTTSSGVYVPTGMESIPGAKYLHAAYMTDGTQGYIVVSYVSRLMAYNWDPWFMTWVAGGYGLNFEYRIYDWTVPTATCTFTSRGFVTGAPTPNPPSHPLYIPSGPLAPGYNPVYTAEGTMVMDVSKNANRVAFAYTCNGNWVQLKVGNMVGNTLVLGPEQTVAGGYAKNPLDIAFRHDPTVFPVTGPKDFASILFEDGSGGYLVLQCDYDWAINPGAPGVINPIADDANPISVPTYNGTLLGTTLSDHIKLDVPDEGIERKWAYTWSDGNNIYLRRFSRPSSTVSGGPIGSSVTHIINNGTILDMFGMPTYNTSRASNGYASIAFKSDNFNKTVLVGWTSNVTIPFSGLTNLIAAEYTEDPMSWTLQPRLSSAPSYLYMQTNNTTLGSGKALAFSHHSITTADLLYNCFVQDDALLQHKNHVMSTTSTWRKTENTAGQSSGLMLHAAPNPFSNDLKLTGTTEGNCSAELVDFTGRTVLSAHGDLNTINAELKKTAPSLTAGIYILRVHKDKGEPQVFKLIRE